MGIIVRQSIKSTVVNYVGTFIGFLTTVIVATRWLTDEEIGLTRVLFEAATLLACLAQVGITSSAIRFFPRFKNQGELHNGFFFYLMIIPLIGSLVVVPLYFLCKELIAGYFQARSSLFVEYIDWLVPLMLFLVYLGVFEVYANLLMRIVIPRFIREVVIRVLIVTVYLLYGFRLIGLTGFVAGYVLTYGVAMALNFWYLSRITSISLRHDYSSVSLPVRKDFFKYTAFLMIGIVGNGIASRLDLFMVSGMLGLASGGIYTIAFFMAAIIELPSRSITAISTPIAAEALQAGDFVRANALYKKVALHQLIAGGFIFLLLWANIDNAYHLIPNGDDFRAGKWVVFYIGFSRLIILFLGFGYSLLSFSRYYRWALYLTLFVFGVTMLSNYLLIPRFGITGAAMATLCAVIITYAAQQWLVLAKIKGNPYTRESLVFLLLLVGLFGLNSLLPVAESPWADGIYRTAILGVTGGGALYFFHLSEEIDRLMQRILHYFFIKRD
ncbi:MAG: oligosaccharide flippase family protein [Odoribacteraceae bacterium]|jgi:O-antigen/teichoic acid export membrane protein|nr:oligosaccharide flippase family protein [Odoribacteraceae bacterium]